MYEPIKIGIVGAGNVGRVLGVMLSQSGYYVEVVTGRNPKNLKIDNYTAYKVTGDFGNKSYLVNVKPDEKALSENLDIIFVCTKIFDAVPIMKTLRSKIKPNGAIVTIQNNFWIDRVMRLINPNNAVFMYLDFSCENIDEKIYVKNYDGIKLGIITKEAYPLLEKVHDVLSNVCRVKDTNDIVGLTVGRSIINTTIASLGGISGLKLKDILLDRNGKFLFVKSIKEKVHLFESFNINILPYDDKLDYYMFTKNSFRSKIYRHKIIRLLIKNNGEVQSSALRDFENNRKSELIIILDSFLKHCAQKAINVPYTKEIFKILNEISKGEKRINKNVFYEKSLVRIGEKNDNRRN